jgi:hypothetical protein
MATFATGISAIPPTALPCHQPNEFGEGNFGPFSGNQDMSDHQNPKRIVNLSDYRAARAALKAQAVPPSPYLLWYPGLGYVQVNPSVTSVAPSGLPIGRNHPHY